MSRSLLISFSFVLCSLTLSSQCVSENTSKWAQYWATCEISTNPNPAYGSSFWIHYDLGDTVVISGLQIWNINTKGSLDLGVRQLVVDYSKDGQSWSNSGIFDIDMASGEANYQGQLIKDWIEITARYLLFTPIKSWADGPCVGFSEIKLDIKDLRDEIQQTEEDQDSTENDQFCGIPESSFALIFLFNEVEIYWDEIEQAESYLLTIREVGSEDRYEIETDDAEVYIEELESNTYYEYVIVVNCPEGDAKSETFTFFIPDESDECNPPDWFEVILLEEDEVLINWNPMEEAILYEVRYRTQEEKWEIMESEENLIEIYDLKANSIYEYQIRVNCDEGWTPYSAPHFFSTDIEVDFLTASKEIYYLDGAFTFLIYPNPSDGKVNVRFSNIATGERVLNVYNLDGKTLMKSVNIEPNNEDHFELSTTELLSGVYLVRVQNVKTGHAFLQKMVVIGDK